MVYKEFQLYSKTSQRTQRKKRGEIGKRTTESFDELKDKITSQPVLALPKREGKFQVETDTSEHTIGGVLSQEQDSK